ncbi:MAG: hypothetical protein JRJ41_03455 [Deltaproteobacteria bacterium]|nr:hypothetical protein [Deltaproteobacteria bacterium]
MDESPIITIFVYSIYIGIIALIIAWCLCLIPALREFVVFWSRHLAWLLLGISIFFAILSCIIFRHPNTGNFDEKALKLRPYYNFVLAYLSLMADFSLSLDTIADYLKSKTPKELCQKTPNVKNIYYQGD